VDALFEGHASAVVLVTVARLLTHVGSPQTVARNVIRTEAPVASVPRAQVIRRVDEA
jgi:hypothetical protein